MTSTVAVQVEPAVIDAPVTVPNDKVVAPAAGDQFGEPKQVVEAFAGLATSKPTGSVSVKVTPVRSYAAACVLLSVKVKVDVTTHFNRIR